MNENNPRIFQHINSRCLITLSTDTKLGIGTNNEQQATNLQTKLPSFRAESLTQTNAPIVHTIYKKIQTPCARHVPDTTLRCIRASD